MADIVNFDGRKTLFAEKIMGVFAMPLETALILQIQPSFAEGFLQSLEGREPLPDNPEGMMLTMGLKGEMWLQQIAKMQKKYQLRELGVGPWQIWDPIPGGTVEVAFIDDMDEFSCDCSWAPEMVGFLGDVVVISRDESGKVSGYYRIERSIFDATYRIISA